MSYIVTYSEVATQHTNLFMNALNDPRFCDVTFIIGPDAVKFETNRAFLAICSPVFKAMLFGVMKESKTNSEIVIRDINADAFQCVLNHAYCTDPEFSVENVAAVRRIADKYQITLLKELCDAYFQENINAENVCILLSSAIEWKHDDWIEKCIQSLPSWPAYEILESDGFLNLNLKAIQMLLQSDDFGANEETIWDGVLRWIDHQSKEDYQGLEEYCTFKVEEKIDESQEQHLPSTISSNPLLQRLSPLTPSIRYGLMGGKFIVEKVNPIPSNKMDQWIKKCMHSLPSYAWPVLDILESNGYLDHVNEETIHTLMQCYNYSVKEEPIWNGMLHWIDGPKVANYASDTSEDRISLLKRLCPFIRFGLMNGEYFVENVRPQKCLSDKDVGDIACYILHHDSRHSNDSPDFNEYELAQCGRFSVTPRTAPIVLLEYTVESSEPERASDVDDYKWLESNDLGNFIYVDTQPTTDAWMEFCFGECKSPIRVEIAAPVTDADDDDIQWDVDDLNECKLQYLKNDADYRWDSDENSDEESEEWIDIVSCITVQEKEIKRFDIEDHIRTEKLRIYREGDGHLAVGCLRIYELRHTGDRSVRLESIKEKFSRLFHATGEAMISCLFSIWSCFSILLQNAVAISEEEVIPGSLVMFHWNKRPQSDPDLERRARVLDGCIAKIMDKPLWDNQRRVQIQSLEDYNLTLGVRMRYLELVRPPPPPMDKEVQIDLFVSRSKTSTSTLTHITSDEYLHQELRIADDTQYHTVLTNHPNSTSQTAMGFNNWTPCIDSGLNQPNLALILLQEGIDYMSSLEMPDERAGEKLRSLLSRCIWHIWGFENVDPTLPIFPSIMESDIFTLTSRNIRRMMNEHYIRLEQKRSFLTLEGQLEFADGWKLAMFIIREYLHLQTLEFDDKIEFSLGPNLNRSAMEFYEKQMHLMDVLFRSEDSEFMSAQGVIESPLPDRYREISYERIRMECKKVMTHVRDCAIKIHHTVEAMGYYLAVGEILVEFRKSEEPLGKIAIVCVQKFVTGDWIRAISDIMQCGRSCVSMKVIPNDSKTPIGLSSKSNAIVVKQLPMSRYREYRAKMSSPKVPDHNASLPVLSDTGLNNRSTAQNQETQTDDEIAKNRTKVTLYGLVASQLNLDHELHRHLLYTTESDLFISMVRTVDSEQPSETMSKTYWTQQDVVLEMLTGDPTMWFNATDRKVRMMYILRYFSLWDDNAVDKVIESMEEIYYNKSEEHHLLCLEIRNTLGLFRKTDERSLSLPSEGTQLRITIETLNMFSHWWQIALYMAVQKTNQEVKFLLSETKYGQHYQKVTDVQGLNDTLHIFMQHSDEIIRLIESYTEYVMTILTAENSTNMEIRAKAAGLGASIHAHSHIITAMKHHWQITMQCFDWMQKGNEGKIIVITPSVLSMPLMHKLLEDIGIREEDQKIIRVEKETMTEHVEGKQDATDSVTFKMTEISSLDTEAMMEDD